MTESIIGDGVAWDDIAGSRDAFSLALDTWSRLQALGLDDDVVARVFGICFGVDMTRGGDADD